MVIFCTSFAQDIPESIKQKLENYENQIEQYKHNSNSQLELEYLNKAAFLCWDNQVLDKSIKYFKRILDLNINLGNKNGIFLSANYIGMIYSEMEDFNSANTYFYKSLEVSKSQNNRNNITSTLVNIAQTHQLLENFNESNLIALEGVVLSKELNNLKLLRTFYGILANNYQNLGNSEKSIEYFDLFASIDKYLKKQEIKDIKQESENKISKAETEKKQTEEKLELQTDKLKETEASLAQVEELTREQRMQLELKESKIREQAAQLKFERLVRIVLICGFIALILFLGVLAILYKKIRIQKNKIEEQRDILDVQNKKISSSLHYAQNIQRAILPLTSQIKTKFESFIIYRPKDIVSGDFYWFSQLDKIAFIAAIDCTGHGVPGAFMSMIGNSLLNEIVLEKKITEPAKVLSLLNEKIIESLRQNETENNDGMDVCFIAIDTIRNEITFSGAKRPLYFFHKNNKELTEIKGDRISIGGTKKQEEKIFQNQKLQVESGDVIYLSSDGLTDQNNVERKRYGSKRLKEIILKNNSEPMERQKEIIEEDLDTFQGDEEQRDDITFIGVKIK